MKFGNCISHVIFDMDGTIVDSDPIYEDGWRYAFKNYNIKLEDEVIEGWGGLSVDNSTAALANIVGNYEIALELRQIRESYFYDQLEKNSLKLMPFVIELFELLKKKDITISLATSTHEEKGLKVLHKLNIDHYFTSKIFGDQVIESKPHPDIYLKTQKILNANESNTLVIEDSLTGVSAALKAGLPVIMVPYRTLLKPEELIGEKVLLKENLGEVLDWFNTK
ncbi:HAD family hydrolase [Fundicoccus sp. Sow4_D5]|uniref:HAD family hydrolase n=1 Tax=Fundicoccus sp. Sow4_D5 TaxID=3438782 RepID=UPI003F8EB8BB